MKKSTFNVGLLSIVLILNSCSNELELIKTLDSDLIENESIVYPLAENAKFTRASSLETDWENMTHVTLPQAGSTPTPWAHVLGEPSNHNIPLDIAEDIKANDGWELIAHTMTSTAARHSNYLFFHNYLTGVLKVFYYINGNPTANNTGFWKIEFSGSQRMLNFADEIADPLSYGGSRKTMTVSNLIKDPHKGFTSGWNCFQVELAYDPNFTTGTMSISAYNSNTRSVNLEGLFEASHTGTIVSQSSNSSTGFDTKGVATLIGDAADKWLEKKSEEGSIEGSSTTTRGISPTLIAGAVKAFSSVIGKKKDSSSSYDIQLKTEGKITMNGTITSVDANTVLPINLSCAVANVGALGGWNLSASPTVYLPYMADYTYSINSDHFYKSPGFSRIGVNIVRNPKTSSKATLVSSTTSFDVIYHSLYSPQLSSDYNNFSGGALYNGTSQTDKKTELVYRDSLENNQIRILKHYGMVEVDCYTNDVLDSSQNPMPKVDLRKVKFMGTSIGFKGRFVRFKYEQKVRINGEETTIVNSKTFYPKYEWDN